MVQMKSVVIIEDHEMMRAGLALRLEGRWHIAGEAGSIREVKALFTRLAQAPESSPPDLVLLDIELGTDWGLDILRAKFFTSVFKGNPPVLIYSAYNDFAHINAALRSGARGYIYKTQGVDDLLEAMEKVAAGTDVFPPFLLRRLAAVSDLVMGLTKREREIFTMVQRGMNNNEIAAGLGVSIRTIENNLSILYDKTGVKNRRELEKL